MIKRYTLMIVACYKKIAEPPPRLYPTSFCCYGCLAGLMGIVPQWRPFIVVSDEWIHVASPSFFNAKRLILDVWIWKNEPFKVYVKDSSSFSPYSSCWLLAGKRFRMTDGSMSRIGTPLRRNNYILVETSGWFLDLSAYPSRYQNELKNTLLAWEQNNANHYGLGNWE